MIYLFCTSWHPWLCYLQCPQRLGWKRSIYQGNISKKYVHRKPHPHQPVNPTSIYKDYIVSILYGRLSRPPNYPTCPIVQFTIVSYWFYITAAPPPYQPCYPILSNQTFVLGREGEGGLKWMFKLRFKHQTKFSNILLGM